MSITDTLEADFADVRAGVADISAKVEEFAVSKLPAATADLKKLEALAGTPVGESLLAALHVPADAITEAVVPLINWLAKAYPKTDAAAEPADQAAPADPAMGEQPAAA